MSTMQLFVGKAGRTDALKCLAVANLTKTALEPAAMSVGEHTQAREPDSARIFLRPLASEPRPGPRATGVVPSVPAFPSQTCMISPPPWR